MSQTQQSIKSLTPKQEKFCLLVSTGSSYSEAYRDAYRAEKMLPKTVHREACRLAHNPSVTTRLSRLKEGVESDTRASIVNTRRWVIDQLQHEATNADTAMARLRGLELLGKAVGLFDTHNIEASPRPRSSAEILDEIRQRLGVLFVDGATDP